MNINIGNLIKAVAYFIIGAFINIIMYYVFSPQQANLVGILAGLAGYSLDQSALGIIWGTILIAGVIINLMYPIWVMFDEEEEKGEVNNG